MSCIFKLPLYANKTRKQVIFCAQKLQGALMCLRNHRERQAYQGARHARGVGMPGRLGYPRSQHTCGSGISVGLEQPGSKMISSTSSADCCKRFCVKWGLENPRSRHTRGSWYTRGARHIRESSFRASENLIL